MKMPIVNECSLIYYIVNRKVAFTYDVRHRGGRGGLTISFFSDVWGMVVTPNFFLLLSDKRLGWGGSSVPIFEDKGEKGIYNILKRAD